MTYFEKLHKGIRLDAEVFLPKEAATVRHLWILLLRRGRVVPAIFSTVRRYATAGDFLVL